MTTMTAAERLPLVEALVEGARSARRYAQVRRGDRPLTGWGGPGDDSAAWEAMADECLSLASEIAEVGL